MRQEAVVLPEREPVESNLLHLARHKADGAGLEQLVSGIASGIGQLEKDNQQLRERNAQLEAAIRQSDERAAQLEAAMLAKAEAARATLQVVAQSLLRAEEAVDATQKAAAHPGSVRYVEAAKRVLDLQKEVIDLLERAQEEIIRRDQDGDQKATAILREARRGVLAVADEVAPHIPDRTFPLAGDRRAV